MSPEDHRLTSQSGSGPLWTGLPACSPWGGRTLQLLNACMLFGEQPGLWFTRKGFCHLAQQQHQIKMTHKQGAVAAGNPHPRTKEATTQR